MAIINTPKGTVIEAGTKFIDVMKELDVLGAIDRMIEYRKSHELPLLSDVYYTQQEGGSWKMERDAEIIKYKPDIFEETYEQVEELK